MKRWCAKSKAYVYQAEEVIKSRGPRDGSSSGQAVAKIFMIGAAAALIGVPAFFSYTSDQDADMTPSGAKR